MDAGIYAGMRVYVKTAYEQKRTPQDVPGAWVRPKVPSKRDGRRGTRRAWKRKNAPHRCWLYREPADVLIVGSHTMIVTPSQLQEIQAAIRNGGAAHFGNPSITPST